MADIEKIQPIGDTEQYTLRARTDSEGNVITDTYLKRSGGTMTGPLKWDGNDALPNNSSLQYFLGITAFADGGTTQWTSKTDAATSLDSVHKWVRITGDTMTGALTMSKTGDYLYTTYNGTNYVTLHNHNNGNLSLSAPSGGLYIGYWNTTLINWLSGKMQLNSDGNLGIGTTSPSYKLHVVGDVYANGGWLRSSGNTGWYNESYGGGWYMQDTTYIRNYNSKQVYINAQLGVDATLRMWNSNRQITRAGYGVSWYQGRIAALCRVDTNTSSGAWFPICSSKTTNGDWSIGSLGNTWYFSYCTDTNFNNSTNSTNITARITNSGQIYGAVWNDYAEMRDVPEANTEDDKVNQRQIKHAGRCVYEIGDDTMALTTERLMRGCKVISDTYGFAIGEDENHGLNTPIAVSGRTLCYLLEGREEAKKHIGWPVCSGPDGTVSIMSEEEEEKYPSRIVGTISAVPEYETWGTGNVKVDGRIWIYVR